ncbi:MAG: AhpC/TSA family protein [Anaerolineales bacterium]|nr:AhpC/TSA family protein [Anaerolineales bacterium]
MLKPRQPVPSLSVPTVGGGTWTLNAQAPQNFTLIAFYRGRHCPVCKRYLADLHRKVADFAARGVAVVAVSTDTAARAAETKTEWELHNLTVGYGMSIDKAREWGLYISTSRGKTSLGILEPDLFSEPGLFLVRPDGTLYAAIYLTMPWGRPLFAEILAGLDFILANDYPARGEA